MAGQHVQTGTLAGMDYDSGKVEVDFEGADQRSECSFDLSIF
jgi:hypothetical protein